MSALDVMSWVIGLANPLSAVLVGPALVRMLDHLGIPRWTVRAQGAGWLVLAIAQSTFLVFGHAAGYPGFKYAQPFMVPVAALNFVMWLITCRAHRQVPRSNAYGTRSLRTPDRTQ